MSLRNLWLSEVRQLWTKHYRKILIMVLFGIGIMATSHASAKSIDSLEKINLGGIKQWIYITGQDTHKPILLILHGGPGEAMMPLFHHFNRELEQHFVVVNWDQRGAGKSYSKNIAPETMTLNQFVSDAHELTTLLKKRFKQQKIYLLAHSSGTMIAIPLIQQYPKDYFAYVGVGQVVSFAQNEIGSYHFVFHHALATGNQKAIAELSEVGPPDAKGNYRDDAGYDITSKWVENFGAEIHDQLKNQFYDVFIAHSAMYRNKNDARKRAQGLIFSEKLFDDPAMKEFDVKHWGLKLAVPVYFMSGKYDYDTPVGLVKEYYAKVQSRKAFIEFEHSAHNPFYEEPERFNQVMINTVLAETYVNAAAKEKSRG